MQSLFRYVFFYFSLLYKKGLSHFHLLLLDSFQYNTHVRPNSLGRIFYAFKPSNVKSTLFLSSTHTCPPSNNYFHSPNSAKLALSIYSRAALAICAKIYLLLKNNHRIIPINFYLTIKPTERLP